MARIVAFVHLTLDGVMQAPARPDEDCRGGFEHGGWAGPYADDPVLGQAVGESMSRTGALLLGRRTYEDFYQVWPNRKDGNPFTPVLNNALKYVASRTRQEPLPWMNSKLLAGSAEEHVANLRRQPGKDIVILGSGMLVQSLLRAGLIDELMLTISPILLGSGRRLFADQSPAHTLRLVESRTTTKGVLVTRYQPVQASRQQDTPLLAAAASA
jgi:dihydrofolate reductase